MAPKGSQSEEGTTNRASVAQRVFGPLVLALSGSQRTGYWCCAEVSLFFPLLGGREEERVMKMILGRSGKVFHFSVAPNLGLGPT